MATIRACRPSFDQSVQALTERIDALEKKLESGAYTVQAAPANAAQALDPAAPSPAAAVPAAPRKRPTRPVPEGEAAIWKDVLQTVKSTRMQLYTTLRVGAFHGFKADFADITFDEDKEIFHAICVKDENRAVIEQAFSDVCQRPISAQITLNRADESIPHLTAPVDEGYLFSTFGRENVDILD